VGGAHADRLLRLRETGTLEFVAWLSGCAMRPRQAGLKNLDPYVLCDYVLQFVALARQLLRQHFRPGTSALVRLELHHAREWRLPRGRTTSDDLAFGLDRWGACKRDEYGTPELRITAATDPDLAARDLTRELYRAFGLGWQDVFYYDDDGHLRPWEQIC
ncbi:MAG: hypothetical protein ACE5R4_13550, partial [Armatimonadota bacterium]